MLAQLLKDSPWPQTAGTRTAAGPLYGSSDSLLIGELARQERLLVVVAEDTSQAQVLVRELPFYLTQDTEILQLPDWEILPYDNFSPHQDIVSERLRTLYRLPRSKRGILILPMSALLQRLPPRDYVEANSLALQTGQALDVESLRTALSKSGYRSVHTVYEHGEYALRGSLMDLFPMGSSRPLRIDLLDDEIDSLRSFDPETQRTVEKVAAVDLLPAREFPLDRRGIQRFQQNWFAAFEVDHDLCPMFQEISQGRAPGGAEYYLPLFFERCELLLDYLPEDAAIIAVGDHHGAANRFRQEAQRRYEEFNIDPRRPLLSPNSLFASVEELYHELKRFAVLELRRQADAPVHIETGVRPPPQLASGAEDQGLHARLTALLGDHSGPVLLCAESAGRREILQEALDDEAPVFLQLGSIL